MTLVVRFQKWQGLRREFSRDGKTWALMLRVGWFYLAMGSRDLSAEVRKLSIENERMRVLLRICGIRVMNAEEVKDFLLEKDREYRAKLD